MQLAEKNIEELVYVSEDYFSGHTTAAALRSETVGNLISKVSGDTIKSAPNLWSATAAAMVFTCGTAVAYQIHFPSLSVTLKAV